MPSNRRAVTDDTPTLTVHGARENNLRELDVSFPLGRFTCVTGVSGSGKSTLVTQVLLRALRRRMNGSGPKPGTYKRMLGGDNIDRVIDVDQSPIGSAFAPLALAGDGAVHAGLSSEQRELLTDYAAQFLEAGTKVTAIQYVQAEQQRVRLWQTFDEFLARYDLLLTPVLATPAFPIDNPPTVIDGKQVRPLAWTPFTMICNLTGQPAASLPCGRTSAGLPVGLHMIARAFRERTILEAALAFQRAHPWQDEWPKEPSAK
ncbi:MAG: hypothetical protein IIC26_08150 [Chloroflexi bacterium]|nr:hypothetical protein [Chloroflexota bacterium]